MADNRSVAATMWTVGTLSPEEAEQHWRDKKEREDAAAAESEAVAKVVRPQVRKGPRSTGAETK